MLIKCDAVRRVLLLTLFVALVCGNPQIIYVSSTNGSSDNNCGVTASSACISISLGISRAAEGDIITLLPGTYSGVGNSLLNITVANLTINSSAGPTVTTIVCTGITSSVQHWVLVYAQGTTSISGLTFTSFHPRRDQTDFYHSIISFMPSSLSVSSALIINNCIFAENTVVLDSYQGIYAAAIRAIGIPNANHTLLVSNVVFRNNLLEAIASNNINTVISNCTFFNNTSNYHVINLVHSILANSMFSAIVGSTFENNKSGRYAYPSMIRIEGYENKTHMILVERCKFSNNKGGLWMINSNAIISNCSFSNINGVALVVGQSPYIIDRSNIALNYINSTANKGFCECSYAIMKVTNSKFVQEQLAVFSFQQPVSIQFEDCLFDSNLKESIAIKSYDGLVDVVESPSAQIVFLNTTWQNNLLRPVSIDAISYNNVTSPSIFINATFAECSFIGNHDSQIAALSIYGLVGVTLVSSTFQGNSAEVAGAISCQSEPGNYSVATISFSGQECIFKNNKVSSPGDDNLYLKSPTCNLTCNTANHEICQRYQPPVIVASVTDIVIGVVVPIGMLILILISVVVIAKIRAKLASRNAHRNSVNISDYERI